MSNVLIGIIGVILFIGLALAGALFLGPRFQESTHNSKAAAIAQNISQIANASVMYEAQEGKQLLASNFLTNGKTLVDRGYMKSYPTNPVNGDQYYTVDANGGDSASPVKLVFTSLGNDANARSICRAIEAMSGGTNVEADLAPTSFGSRTSTRKRVGCVNNQDYTNGMYQAYAPI
jgi:hypothetical protein